MFTIPRQMVASSNARMLGRITGPAIPDLQLAEPMQAALSRRQSPVNQTEHGAVRVATIRPAVARLQADRQGHARQGHAISLLHRRPPRQRPQPLLRHVLPI